MELKVEINPEEHGVIPQHDVKEMFSLLNSLYCDIWCESSYDPCNEDTRKFAKKMLPNITRLNDILKFKA